MLINRANLFIHILIPDYFLFFSNTKDDPEQFLMLIRETN